MWLIFVAWLEQVTPMEVEILSEWHFVFRKPSNNVSFTPAESIEFFQKKPAHKIVVAIAKKCMRSCYKQASWGEVERQCYEASSDICSPSTLFVIQVISIKLMRCWMSALSRKTLWLSLANNGRHRYLNVPFYEFRFTCHQGACATKHFWTLSPSTIGLYIFYFARKAA